MPHKCTIGKATWDVPSLWDEAKKQKLEAFEVNPMTFDLSWWPWSKLDTISELLDLVKDIDSADLKYPIILSKTGAVMDGYHRITKARWQGKKLMAVQFKDDPAPSHVKED